MLRRLSAALVPSSLLLPAVAWPVGASTIQKLVTWYGGGDVVSQQVDGGLATVTQVGFALADQSGTRAELRVQQDVYALLADGSWGDALTERVADISNVPVSIDLTRLSSASISAGADGTTWQTCDVATWTCTDEPFSVSATWTGVGPVLHDHQMEVDLRVGVTLVGANSVGASRAQTADVVLNGQPLVGSVLEGTVPSLFRQTQGIRTILFGAAALAPATTSTAPTLHANLSNLQAIANTSTTTPESSSSTGVIASSVMYLDDGTQLNNVVLYTSVTEYFDEYGNMTGMVEVDGFAPGAVTIDRTLGSASASATSLPVNVCVYGADWSVPPNCSAATVDLEASWVATDKVSHSLVIGNAVTAGAWIYGVHTSTQSRTANAVVTVDGADAGPSVESSIVSSRSSLNSVTLGH